MKTCKKCGKILETRVYRGKYCKRCFKYVDQPTQYVSGRKKQKKAIVKELKKVKLGLSVYNLNYRLGLSKNIGRVREKLWDLKKQNLIDTYFNKNAMETRWVHKKWLPTNKKK